MLHAPKTYLILSLLVSWLIPQHILAQKEIDSLFLEVPMTELPLLEHNSRLDMIDLYNYKMIAKGENIFGGTSVLKKKTQKVLLISLTESSDWELIRLTGKTDTVYSCLHTTYTPAAETIIRFYNTNWALDSTISLPTLSLDNFWCENDSIPIEQQNILKEKLTPLYIKAHWEKTETDLPRLAFNISTMLLDSESRKKAEQCLKPFYWTYPMK